jgi:chorismate lyase/3-hydroxybenzoate synthase
MTLSTGLQVKHERSPCRFDIAPPAWVRDWTAADAVTQFVGGLELTVAQGPNASLVAVTVPGAAGLTADQFERRASEVYRAIRDTLATLPHRSPVRFWNYLPAIHEPMDERRDRYMVFNAGRFAAMCDWFGGPHHLAGRLPAASGVGHAGAELVVHCLACGQGGQAVENPRQVPAFQYSRRYGPLPPCFARATVITHPFTGGRALLVAGTSSILGEQTVHAGDLPRQLEETLANLRALLAAVKRPGERWGFTDLRAYYSRLADAATVERLMSQTIGPEVKVQMVHAELCRTDLLVEIEGVAAPNAGARCE